MVRRLRSDLWRDRGGMAMVEFALALPVLITILLGGIEFARFAMINQKLDRVASFIGDFAARSDGLSTAALTDFFAAAQQLASPYNLDTGGRLVLTSIVNDGNGPEIDWQEDAGGILPSPSRLGETPGDAAALPEGFTVAEGDVAVVTEVFFNYQPWFLPHMMDAQILYARSFHRPRLADELPFTP